MTSKAKMFDGYANAYDQWFMKNENVFASELKLLHRLSLIQSNLSALPFSIHHLRKKISCVRS